MINKLIESKHINETKISETFADKYGMLIYCYFVGICTAGFLIAIGLALSP